MIECRAACPLLANSGFSGQVISYLGCYFRLSLTLKLLLGRSTEEFLLREQALVLKEARMQFMKSANGQELTLV